MKKYFSIIFLVFLLTSCGNNSINNTSENEKQNNTNNTEVNIEWVQNINKNEAINIETTVEWVWIVTVEDNNEKKNSELNEFKNNTFSSETNFDLIDTEVIIISTSTWTEAEKLNSSWTGNFDYIDIEKSINLGNSDSWKSENENIKWWFSN